METAVTSSSAAPGALVERLDVGELVHVAEVAGVELPFRQRVEHEGVVGVGAVGDVDGLGHGFLGTAETDGEAERTVRREASGAPSSPPSALRPSACV